MEIIKYAFLSFVICILYSGCIEKKIENDGLNDKIQENEKIFLEIGNKEQPLIFSFDKVNNVSIERIYRQISFTSELTIGSLEDETFLGPGRVKLDNRNNIYVLDFIDCSVKKFDMNGIFLKKYGSKGRGPGELTTPYDFDVSTNGDIAFLGLNDNKFIIFKDSITEDIKCNLMPNRLCFISNAEVITFQIMDPIFQSPVKKTDLIEGNTIDYENFINKNSFNGRDFGLLPVLIGDIHRYNEKNLIYVSSILGYVILFKENGMISDAFKLIDGFKKSSTKRKEKVINDQVLIGFPRKEEYLFESSNVSGDRLFIFSNKSSETPPNYVIDVYSLVKKEYEYSFKLEVDDNIVAVFSTTRKIVLVKENTEVEVLNYTLIN